jgi:hypothetical protein
VFSAPQRWRSLSLIPLVFGFRGRWYTHGGAGRGGPGRPHHWVAQPRASPRHLVVWAPGGWPHPLLLVTSVFRWNMNFWVFSWNC